MNLIPMGFYSEDGDVLCLMKASDYSDSNYDGIQLRKSRDGMPVIISRSKKTAPLMWKVAYGFSTIFFRTFEEAVGFCSSRGMEIVKRSQDREASERRN